MKPLRILLAEDDAMIGLLLADLLGGWGHDCTVAVTEAETVAAANFYQPDLMIVDAQLGDGSGIAAVQRIILKGPVPHLFVSGDAARVLRAQPGALVLQKPFREEQLMECMDLALDTPAIYGFRSASPSRSPGASPA